MWKLLWITSLLLIPGVGLASNDICVHLNGGDDVAYIGEYNTLEIWVANDIDISSLQFSFAVSWPSDTTDWLWITDYGMDAPFDRHGDAVDHLILFASSVSFDGDSPETFAAGAVALIPYQNLPPGPSRLCYSLQFGLLSHSTFSDAIQIQPYAYFGSTNWFFTRTDASRFPPDFCGEPVSSIDYPMAPPVLFSIVHRPPPSCGDVDCNDIVNISDAVYMITYIFGGGPAPCAGCP